VCRCSDPQAGGPEKCEVVCAGNAAEGPANNVNENEHLAMQGNESSVVSWILHPEARSRQPSAVVVQ